MMRWLFSDGSSSDRRYATRILDSVRKTNPQIIVPYFWVYEAAFVVNYYVGEGALDSLQAASHLDSLFDLCTVAIDKESPAALFDFSRTHGVSAYDAAYLVLARAQNSQLATLDKKMRRVARKLGIEILLDQSK
jgi:predicted nucleic acid-binding protein